MTAILGINAYHGDSAAALVIDGELVAAVEEERFNRIKHWSGFPAESIRYCMDFARLGAREVDHVAVSFNPRANFRERLKFLLTCRPTAGAVMDRLRRQRKTLSLREEIINALGCSVRDFSAKIHRIEHHETHVAAGFLISPFEEASILSIDSMGDFVSTLTAQGSGSDWKVFDRVYYPHSLGLLYTMVTMYLGFPYYGDEYKVMGLAPYGEPEFVEFFRKLVKPDGDTFRLNLDYFTHQKGGVRTNLTNGNPIVDPFHSPLLEKELGPMRNRGEECTKRHENIAKSLQVVTEDIIIHLLCRLYDKTRCPNVCLTGGVAMNSVANGKVTRETPFKNVYLPAGAADNGTSFGSAFYVWNRLLGQPRKFIQKHAFWGSEFDGDACKAALTNAYLPHEALDEGPLIDRTVEHIMDGKVVGWYQGRMEFGARALGNRSLVADPRRTDMRDIINLRIKYREKFRPFAPSILEEFVGEWFEIAEPTPYMEKVFPVKKDKHQAIPAVTHVDGTGRLQTVSRETNPLYHRLIYRFYEQTGVPILLNTSLNENEPIVRTPSEAINCFLRTDMDVLVLGNHIIDRHRPEFPEHLRKRVKD